MQSPRSRPLSPEEAVHLKKEAVSKAFPEWTLEELQRLEGYLQEPDSSLLRRYLLVNQAVLEREVWAAKSWEHYLVLKGEYRTTCKVLRLPEEIKLCKERFSEARERREEGEE